MKTDKNCACAKCQDLILLRNKIKKLTAEFLTGVRIYLNVYFPSHGKHVARCFGHVIAVYGENHM